MRRRSLAISISAAFLAGGVATAGAADLPADSPVPAAPATVVPPVLGNRPDRPATGPADAPAPAAVVLGQSFESLSGGIALRPPPDGKAIREMGKDDIVEFIEDVKGATDAKGTPKEPSWRLVVSRRSFPQPKALNAGPDELGRMRPGLVQDTVEAVTRQYPGCQMLRQDLTNLDDHDVGMIVYRLTKNGERLFAQRAIVQANDQLFYLVALTTPGRKDDPKGEDAPDDPAERAAVETFRAVLDSVKLLDRQKIRDDQVQRLFHTRTWLTNLTPQKLSATLIPQQWYLVYRDGQPVGWQYVVEQPDRKAGQDGIKVGIRTRITAGGRAKVYPLEESEAWMSTTNDRRHEDWSKLTAYDDGLPHTPEHPWNKTTELGSSDVKTKRSAVVAPRLSPNEHVPMADAYKVGELGDPGQPWVDVKSAFTLNVQYVGNKLDIEPVVRPLPPYYLPQALGLMLPRLVPPNEVKQYLVASYVSDAHEVMLRYIDVGREQDVKLGGRVVQAIPVTDRLTYQGTATTHYIDAKGRYLGSVNNDTKTTIVASDAKTVLDLWPDAKLERPGELRQDEPEAGVPPTPGRGGSAGNVPATLGPAAPFINPTGPRR